MIPHETIRYLVGCGTRASSADNCQPWRFVFTGRHLHVYLERTTAFYDVDSLPSYLALGGVIENLRIAASRLGYRTDVTRLPEGERSDLAARVALARNHQDAPDPLSAFLDRRCTNRGPYSRRPIPVDVLGSLQGAERLGSGFRLVLRSDTQTRRMAASLVMKADWIRFEHEQIHREFHAALRFTPEEKEQRGDGLSLDTLALGSFAGPFFRFHRPWKRTARLNRLGLGKVMALHTYLLAIRAGAIGLLLGPSWTPLTSLHGGEIFQRMWLAATGQNLAVQPMAALPLHILRVDRADGAGFDEHHLRLIATLKAALREAFQVRPDEAILMFFRMGYASPPRGRSARRPVPEVLTFHQREFPDIGPAPQPG